MENADRPIIRIYFAPLSYPCGPESACCGPVGQSQAEIETLAADLGAAFPQAAIATVDTSAKLNLGRDLAVMKLLNSFGPSACPIVTVNGTVVSLGSPHLAELIPLVRERLARTASTVGSE
jgi:hypothetical protein